MNGVQISPKLLSCNIDEAKNNAADTALAQLGFQPALPPVALNEYFNQAGMQQLPPVNYLQGRPLATAHGVNLNSQPTPGTPAPIQTSTSTTPLTTSSTPTTPSNTTTTRPQNVPLVPDFVPVMAAPYFFDPASKLNYKI